MRTVNEESRRAKQIDIMEKCFDCYAENGLGGVGVKAISNACGCNVASLYQYFENLDDIINPEKPSNTKNAAKQGNAGERPDAAARYTVKSSGDNSLLFKLHRYLPADKPWGYGGGTPDNCQAANLSSK